MDKKLQEIKKDQLPQNGQSDLIDEVAKAVLQKYKKAFLELAK